MLRTLDVIGKLKTHETSLGSETVDPENHHY